MATHSSIHAWRIPMDSGAWPGYSLWVRKEADTTEGISTHTKYTMKFAISTTLSV